MPFKSLFLLSLLLLCTSCLLPTYTAENNVQSTNLNFSEGKWLLNSIDAPADVSNELYAASFKDFTYLLGSRLNARETAKGIMLPGHIPVKPTKGDLADLYKGTGYDYFINIKAIQLKDDFGVVDLINNRYDDNNSKKSGEVTLELYDLKNSTVIYSRTVRGTIFKHDNLHNVHISKSLSGILLASYKNIIKDIKNRSFAG